MYVPDHLKWRIAIARTLKTFFYENENSNRNLTRVFDVFAKFLLGTTYDTFLTYLNTDKYDISSLRLPPFILTALALLDALRLTCDRLFARRPNTSWSLIGIVEELLVTLRDEQRKGHAPRRITID